jgi:chemotaxis signal transduction protein
MNAPLTQAPPVVAAARGWLLLDIDDRRLALPQRDIRQIELAVDLVPAMAGSRSIEVGWFVPRDGDSWPAYSFNAALELRQPAPAGQKVCVFVEAANQRFGVLCNRVSPVHTDAELEVEPVPGCLARAHSPIVGFARVGDGLAIVTDGDALASYLGTLREQDR